MNTYNRTKTNYRKIWEEANNQKIPKGYHIHHIDGNHENNDPSNLLCVSPQEHYNIHKSQGDYNACWAMIRTGHMNVSLEERSFISRETQLKKVADGSHHFLYLNKIRNTFGSNNSNYANYWTEDKKLALSLKLSDGRRAGKNNSAYGVKRTDLSERNKAGRGKHWYNNGITSKQYFPNDVPDGWKRGRI